jgi:hypothetical protein
VGAHAGVAQTTATGNVFLGSCVGYGVVGGSGNVYIGDKSGLVNTSGTDNVFIGLCSGCASTASCSLIIGNGTCDLITGSFATPLVSMVGCVGIGTATPNASLTVEAGVVSLGETTTPTATAAYGKVYTKNDNKLYFQDGAGSEHELAFA